MKVTRSLALAIGIPALYFALQAGCSAMISFYYYMQSFTLGGYDPTDASAAIELMNLVLEKVTAATPAIMILSAALFLLVLVAAYHNKPYRVWDVMKLTRNIPGGLVLMAVIAGFGFNLLCVGLMSILPIPEAWNTAHNDVTDALFAGNNILLTIFVTVIAAPLAEEIAFRGYTHRYMARIMPTGTAALVSGLIFGLFHFNWLQTIYAFALGVTLGFIYSWAKNLWATLSFHMAFNGANFVTMPVLYAIYGDAADEIVPMPGALVLLVIGGLMSFYGIMRLYQSRSDIEHGAAVQD